MAGMMGPWWGGYDGYGMMGYGYGYPFGGWWILCWIIVFAIIGYFVYRDANSRGMHGGLWWFLIIIPMVGIFALILYLIIREIREGRPIHEGKTAMDILKERYAKGELTGEQFRTMSEDLKR